MTLIESLRPRIFSMAASPRVRTDRKSTRLNSSHQIISYAVFCLKKKNKAVRFDLFERLNTGGVELTDQEVRDCVFRGKFSELLDRLAQDQNFNRIVKLTASQTSD